MTAVTILTSLDKQDLREIGLQGTPEENVQRLAALARDAGLDGVVCSPREATTLRQRHERNFCLVTPGVRPEGARSGDQKRTLTPREAIAAGADYVVMGRPITQADNPVRTLLTIHSEIMTASSP